MDCNIAGSVYLTNMSAPPRLTDRAALSRARARAAPEALFLHELAADEVKLRLQEVNRSFTAPVIVGGHSGPWQARFPGADFVEDAPTLPLAPGAHDLVILALSLHWADDPVGQLIQARRALKPDGLLLGVTFGGQTLAELRAALAEAEIRLTGGLSPRVAPMAEIRDLGGLLQRAGFALPVADAEPVHTSYRDAHALMRELRRMGETNALDSRLRHATRPGLFVEAAEIYARNFPDPDNPARIRATFELIFLSGWTPDDSQPQPLRPGSAKARLADALGTTEAPLRDDSPGRGD